MYDVAVSDSSEQEECSWVVEKCKKHLSNNDRSAAKAWILTARSLFPDNFDVQVSLGVLVERVIHQLCVCILQYEAFLLHCSCNEKKEAALALSNL